MRILVVDPLASTLPYDQALCAALAALGHEVKLLTRLLDDAGRAGLSGYEREEMPLVNVLVPSDDSVLPARFASAWRHLRYAGQIQAVLRVVRKTRPDVVHFQWCMTPFAELLLLKRLPPGVKTVLTVHDTVPFNGERVSGYLTFALDRLIKAFGKLIVHTNKGRLKMIAQGIDVEKIHVVAHGPLALPWSPMDSRESNDASNFIRFLSFGILRPYKGIDLLIQAAAALPPPIRDRCRFLIVGKPEMNVQDLVALAARLHVEHLFEFDLRYIPDKDVPGYFEKSDVAVFPYRQIEASGVFSLVEQFGLPVIATRIGIFEERIVDRVNGILVEREDISSLSQALAFFAENPGLSKKMGTAMRRASEQRDGWPDIAAKLLAIYRDENR